MLNWIREKFGTVVIGGIISFIAFVFVFYGVFNPKSTRGLHEGAVAGTVNGDPISIAEYNRELNRRIELLKNIAGGKVTEEQLKMFGIRERVFKELANRKLLVQEAKRQGLIASDEEVREKVKEMPSFQKEGKFDLVTYKEILNANNYTPGSFEKLIREDLSAQIWEGYFQDRVHASEEEVKREFQIKGDQRKIKYVLLTPETAKDNVNIDPAAIKKFLEDPAKVNLAKANFEQNKNTTYKSQKFEAVQEMVARNLLAGEKVEEVEKINRKLAEQIVSVLTASSSSDAKVNALIHSKSTQVKTTDWVNRKTGYIPGLGESKGLMADAFAAHSPIDVAQGGKPKIYPMAGRLLVALVVEAKKPDLSQFAAERDSLYRQVIQRKGQDYYEGWMKNLIEKASVDMNPAVVGVAE